MLIQRRLSIVQSLIDDIESGNPRCRELSRLDGDPVQGQIDARAAVERQRDATYHDSTIDAAWLAGDAIARTRSGRAEKIMKVGTYIRA
jgi:hypothetical protein